MMHRTIQRTTFSKLSLHAKMHKALSKKHGSKQEIMKRLERDISTTIEKIEKKELAHDSQKLSSLKELAKELEEQFKELKKQKKF